MIYLDNGATSFPKPREALKAMADCMSRYCGNPGPFRTSDVDEDRRGSVQSPPRDSGTLWHKLSGEACFYKNTTEALNMGLKGALKSGDHVVTTSMEHNSVLRPSKLWKNRINPYYSQRGQPRAYTAAGYRCRDKTRNTDDRHDSGF